MRIDILPIPQMLKQQYEKAGILELYPPQITCVEEGLFDGRNLLIAIPTASGKTLVAEMAMHHHISMGGKCLYIVPLKALASEKYQEFSGKGVRVGISTGDFDRRDEHLAKYDIVIATSEKADSLLRNNARWLSGITLLIVDEVHLIDDESRGATLEMVITKLRCENPRLSVIGLSATIGNPEALASWLDGRVVESDWRPVELREGVYYRGCIHFRDREREIAQHSRFDDLNLCLDTVEEGGQCLVFVSSRRNAEGYAKRAATLLKCTDTALTRLSQALYGVAETEMGKVLAGCVERGAAFHHAGLSARQRELVERGFRDGQIKVIASTPTLAAGLNLPARRVIIRDTLRYQSGEGMAPIPVREYRQMAGRAGRPHLDPYGEAVLIAKGEHGIDELFEAYIDAPPEHVSSRLASESLLTTHLLSLVASRFVRNAKELHAFMEATFHAHTHPEGRRLARIVDRGLSYLEGAEMITGIGGMLEPTRYGATVSRLYIDPRSAELVTSVLQAQDSFSEIGLLQLIASTPDMYTLYVKRDDLPVLERFIFEHEEELWMPFSFEDAEAYFRSLKTALLLRDWVEEVGEGLICERWGVGPGDIYNAVEGVKWLIHATAELGRLAAPHLSAPIAEMELRMKHGIRKELLPLVQLRGIGRVRARRLFNNNITTIAEIREAGIERITSIVGQGIANQIFAQADGSGGEEEREREEERGGQSTLSRFGE